MSRLRDLLRLSFRQVWRQRPRTRKAIEHIQGVDKTSLTAARCGVSATRRDRIYQFALVAIDDFLWDVNGFSPIFGRLFGGEALFRLNSLLAAAVSCGIFFGDQFQTLDHHSGAVA